MMWSIFGLLVVVGLAVLVSWLDKPYRGQARAYRDKVYRDIPGSDDD